MISRLTSLVSLLGVLLGGFTPAFAFTAVPKFDPGAVTGARHGFCSIDLPTLGPGRYDATCAVYWVNAEDHIYMQSLDPNFAVSNVRRTDSHHIAFVLHNVYDFTITLGPRTLEYLIARTLPRATPTAQATETVTPTPTATVTPTVTPTLTPTPTVTSTP